MLGTIPLTHFKMHGYNKSQYSFARVLTLQLEYQFIIMNKKNKQFYRMHFNLKILCTRVTLMNNLLIIIQLNI